MLSKSASTFDNRHVITRGIVRSIETPLHYLIEDNELNRVALFPHEGAALYLGECVIVEGHFSVSSSQGQRLKLTKIKSVLQP